MSKTGEDIFCISPHKPNDHFRFRTSMTYKLFDKRPKEIQGTNGSRLIRESKKERFEVPFEEVFYTLSWAVQRLNTFCE